VNTYLVFIPTSRDALSPTPGRWDLAAASHADPERMAKVDGGGPFFRGEGAGGYRPESPAVSTPDDLAASISCAASPVIESPGAANARFMSAGKSPIARGGAEDLADDDLLRWSMPA
jgi:hypothetical protein